MKEQVQPTVAVMIDVQVKAMQAASSSCRRYERILSQARTFGLLGADGLESLITALKGIHTQHDGTANHAT